MTHEAGRVSKRMGRNVSRYLVHPRTHFQHRSSIKRLRVQVLHAAAIAVTLVHSHASLLSELLGWTQGRAQVAGVPA